MKERLSGIFGQKPKLNMFLKMKSMLAEPDFFLGLQTKREIRRADSKPRSLKSQGFSAQEQRNGPVQKLGPEGYWTIISEMKKDLQLKGPDGKDFVERNECGEKVFYNGSG